MLITRSDDGYFGLRQSLAGVFDKAVSSWFGNASDEHGLTEDGKTVAPLFHGLLFRRDFVPSNANAHQLPINVELI